MTRHAISFDVEDWHQLGSRRVDGTVAEPSADIDDCVGRILHICDELDVKATFFVLGLLARRRPHLVRTIADRGHEIASHSLDHRLVYTMSRAELLEDLRGSKRLLEDLGGTAVVGFRAPEFSMQRLDSPCFEALVEAGFTYDSSVFPIPFLRYGIAGAPRGPFRVDTAAGSIVELPLATTVVGNWRMPIAGGSHFRVLPTTFVTWAARRADRRSESLVFYFHPYEFSRKWLYLTGGLARNRPIAKWVALHNFATWRIERSLRAVCEHLRFAPMRDLASA
jgi:polysaccharide deacetylase family protein (PEP-CTERM system associated)